MSKFLIFLATYLVSRKTARLINKQEKIANSTPSAMAPLKGAPSSNEWHTDIPKPKILNRGKYHSGQQNWHVTVFSVFLIEKLTVAEGYTNGAPYSLAKRTILYFCFNGVSSVVTNLKCFSIFSFIILGDTKESCMSILQLPFRNFTYCNLGMLIIVLLCTTPWVT